MRRRPSALQVYEPSLAGDTVRDDFLRFQKLNRMDATLSAWHVRGRGPQRGGRVRLLGVTRFDGHGSLLIIGPLAWELCAIVARRRAASRLGRGRSRRL